jgi:hypothetical protein
MSESALKLLKRFKTSLQIFSSIFLTLCIHTKQQNTQKYPQSELTINLSRQFGKFVYVQKPKTKPRWNENHRVEESSPHSFSRCYETVCGALKYLKSIFDWLLNSKFSRCSNRANATRKSSSTRNMVEKMTYFSKLLICWSEILILWWQS